MTSPLPVRDGVGATRLRIPREGPWASISDYMVERFTHLDPAVLRTRFARGEIVDRAGAAVAERAPLGTTEFVWYYRQTPVERPIPFVEEILHVDDDLVVIDKPPFLPTTPGGKYLQNSALVRLRNRLANPELVPIHRLDRATSGVLLFAARPQTRGAYQVLFERRLVAKVYEAVSALPTRWDPAAPALNGSPFPVVYRNHIQKRRGSVRVQVDPERDPNAQTRIELIAHDDRVVHTRLHPHSGRMHQLRVHLAALGIGILHDTFYPDLLDEAPDDHARPLQLLARELRFTDPLSGAERVFRSARTLERAPAPGRGLPGLSGA